MVCLDEEIRSPLLSIPGAILKMNISYRTQDTLITYKCLSTLQLTVTVLLSLAELRSLTEPKISGRGLVTRIAISSQRAKDQLDFSGSLRVSFCRPEDKWHGNSHTCGADLSFLPHKKGSCVHSRESFARAGSCMGPVLAGFGQNYAIYC